MGNTKSGNISDMQVAYLGGIPFKDLGLAVKNRFDLIVNTFEACLERNIPRLVILRLL